MRRQILHALPMTPWLLRAADETGFKPLVARASLDGRDGDPRQWKVEAGVVHGSTRASETPREGLIAIQLHVGPSMDVWFRNPRIEAAG